MERDILRSEIRVKGTGEQMDAEFEQQNVNIDEIVSRTQRSFRSRSRRCIYEAPEFTKRLNAFEEIKAGDTVVFDCQWRALPKPTIKWYKDDEEITEDPRYQIETEEIHNGRIRLVIRNAKKKDEGAYKCKAENQEGVASTTGYLSVSGDAESDERTLASKQKEQQHDKQGRKLPPDYVASSAPHLRTIIEQQSVEEREAESLRDQPPSPIQDFIDKVQSGRARGVTWPMIAMVYQNGFSSKDEEESSGSDTTINSQDYDDVTFNVDEDDVFTEELPSREIELLGGRPAARRDEHEGQGRQKDSGRPTPNVTATRTATEQRQKPAARDDSRTPTKSAEEDATSCLHAARLLDILQSRWIYFFPVVSSATFCASATQASPLYMVLPLVVISLVMFHVLFGEEDV